MLGKGLSNITSANAGGLRPPDINPTRDSNPIRKENISKVCLKQHQIGYEFNDTTSAPTDLLSQPAKGSASYTIQHLMFVSTKLV